MIFTQSPFKVIGLLLETITLLAVMLSSLIIGIVSHKQSKAVLYLPPVIAEEDKIDEQESLKPSA
jgi:hypothetical protein